MNFDLFCSGAQYPWNKGATIFYLRLDLSGPVSSGLFTSPLFAEAQGYSTVLPSGH